jgi:hypothetical protein
MTMRLVFIGTGFLASHKQSLTADPLTHHFTPPTLPRELLLVENRVLRSQLEQRLVTEKTSWLPGSAVHHGSLDSPEYVEAVMTGGSQRDQNSEGSRGVSLEMKMRGPTAAYGAMPASGDSVRAGHGSSKLARARVMAGPQVGKVWEEIRRIPPWCRYVWSLFARSCN